MLKLQYNFQHSYTLFITIICGNLMPYLCVAFSQTHTHLCLLLFLVHMCVSCSIFGLFIRSAKVRRKCVIVTRSSYIHNYSKNIYILNESHLWREFVCSNKLHHENEHKHCFLQQQQKFCLNAFLSSHNFFE